MITGLTWVLVALTVALVIFGGMDIWMRHG
jgi:hypothetical protein